MILKLLLCLFFASIFTKGFSQDNLAYAITGQPGGNFNWTDIRVIDMNSGKTIVTLFENGKTKFSFLDAETNQPVSQFSLAGNPVSLQKGDLTVKADKIVINNPSPTSLMSAAAAYDKRHNKFFFASMRTGQLMWLDLAGKNSTPSFYTVEKSLINNVDLNDESFNITRMTIGADGNGYALTNDGSHLIRFTTGNKVVITDMGSLIDAESNKGISVHNKCSSWGGDIVGDAFGKLFLFSAGRSVFEIDPETRITTYKGTINNLSGTFTVNGAAVTDDDNVIVSSANTFEGFYKVNINNLSATKISTQGTIYNASDLASCNLLHQQQKINSVGEPSLKNIEVIGNRFISIYPNPVTNGEIKITFDGKATSKYKISVTDLQGRLIGMKDVYIEGPGQVENFQMHRKQSSGMYLIKITDASRKSIFSDKLIVE
ncbi:MAG: T9SS type A sorting domain-containing protein [Bacteroidota bacterium]|nr:T9SS type A sorting domain-containing protein [Bacteroidota bacterium]